MTEQDRYTSRRIWIEMEKESEKEKDRDRYRESRRERKRKRERSKNKHTHKKKQRSQQQQQQKKITNSDFPCLSLSSRVILLTLSTRNPSVFSDLKRRRKLQGLRRYPWQFLLHALAGLHDTRGCRDMNNGSLFSVNIFKMSSAFSLCYWPFFFVIFFFYIYSFTYSPVYLTIQYLFPYLFICIKELLNLYFSFFFL